MSDIVIDSSVVAKWFLPEADSSKAQGLITQAARSGDQLVVLDLVFPEVVNAIWKRQRQRMITLDEARNLVSALSRAPVRVEPAMRVITARFEIAARYDRAVYDALFIALAEELGARGVTADEPLFNVVSKDFPRIVLLREWP